MLQVHRDPEVGLRQMSSMVDMTMFDVKMLLDLSYAFPIAAWAYDKERRLEKIFFNPMIVASYPFAILMWIYKHEVMHRAAYGEDYQFDDDELGNIALDIVVNRVLHLGDPQTSVQACRAIYHPSSKDCALALARADLIREDVPEEFRPVWEEVWTKPQVPSPYLIYYALLKDEERVKEAQQKSGAGMPSAGPKGGGGKRERPETSPDQEEVDESSPLDQGEGEGNDDGQLSMFGFGDEGEIEVKPELTEELGDLVHDENPRSETPGNLIVRGLPDNLSEEEEAAGQLQERAGGVDGIAASTMRQIERNLKDAGIVIPGGGFSNQMSKFFSKLDLVPQKTRTEEVEEWLAGIRSPEETNETEARLMKALRPEPRVEIIPATLSPTGYLMFAIGVSEATGMWWNEIPKESRPPVRIYVDTSPSMGAYAQKTVHIMAAIEDAIPAQVYAFAGDVVECETSKFADGEYYQGSSTSFDAVIQDAIVHDENLIVVFTDGYSSVTPFNKLKFRQTGKALYVVFCGNKADPNDLRELAADCFVMLHI